MPGVAVGGQVGFCNSTGRDLIPGRFCFLDDSSNLATPVARFPPLRRTESEPPKTVLPSGQHLVTLFCTHSSYPADCLAVQSPERPNVFTPFTLGMAHTSFVD